MAVPRRASGTLTGGETVVRALEENGIRLAYGIPAVHNLPIYDALYGSKRIRSILVRHEQGAGFMAIGSAYASGEPVACIVGCGPGATNVVTSVAEAHLDSVPLLVVAGGIRTSAHGKGALHDVDQLAIFKPITKSSRRLAEPDELAGGVGAAISECRSGRPGPVFLEIPFEILTSTAKGEHKPHQPEKVDAFDPKSLAAVSERLERAERPVIIIGGGVNASRSWGEVAKLAETFRIPVASTISAKGAFPEDSPLSIGQLWDEVAMGAVERADVVLALGCRFSERSTANWRLKINGSLIHVDIDRTEFGRNYPAALAISSDVKDFLSPLLKGIGRPVQQAPREGWARLLAEARAAKDAELERYESSSGNSIRPQRIIHEIGRVIPDGTLIVAETGHAFWWSVRMLKVRRPLSFLAPSGNSTLGFGLPAAMGAKCARPERPVVCLTGDGGFLLTCQELLTAVEERLAVVVVVIDDGGYSAIREYQRKGYDGRFIGVDFDAMPDYVALARSMGAEGILVEKPDGIRPALMGALKGSGPCVVDIPISREESALPKFFTETYRRN